MMRKQAKLKMNTFGAGKYLLSGWHLHRFDYN